MSNQSKIVKSNLHYFFKSPSGEWNIPKEMPFLKEFLTDVEKLCEEKTCEWKVVDYGQMGCQDYQFVTSCGKNYDIENVKKENYCPNCGGKII